MSDLLQATIAPPFKTQEPLSHYCTYGIGGPAKYLLEIHTIEEMQQTLAYCHQHNIKALIIGKGSNCLFDDRGFSGAILINKIDFIKETTPGTFYVGAGYSFTLLGTQTARQGWGGLEFASGIPGSVGGAVFMNAGATGGQTADTLATVDFIANDGCRRTYTKEELTFAYRRSSFQNMSGAIVGATFKLTKDTEARKKQIEIITKRTKTQPYNAKSAGCVFVNPTSGSAGAMIDNCSMKGLNVGGAQVSTLHANFLINAGNATCKDMLALIELVQKRVKESTGTELHMEIRYIPYE